MRRVAGFSRAVSPSELGCVVIVVVVAVLVVAAAAATVQGGAGMSFPLSVTDEIFFCVFVSVYACMYVVMKVHVVVGVRVVMEWRCVL